MQRHFDTSGHSDPWNYVFKVKMPKLLGDFKKWLKKYNYDVYEEDWQRFAYLDERVDPDQYASLCYIWESEDFKV